MEVIVYGTRGSTPGQPRGSHVYGAHTTCLRVKSDCLPKGSALAIDAGSGFVDLSRDLLKEGIMRVGILFTHYHHDHTQGIFLAPHTFCAESMTILGPQEHGIGPQEVLSRLIQAPFFPVEFAKVAKRFNFKPLKHIGTQVLVIHPEGGPNLVSLDVYERALADGKQLAFRTGRYKIEECLVVTMFVASHPEYTVSYRFEEKPTGRIFVFLTDHEVTAGFPRDLLAHLRGAHLLIQDGQYSEPRYLQETAGYGHGTPQYCAATAVAAGIGKLGITHHDPGATDNDIEIRVEEARIHARQLGHPELAESIFACADYSTYQV